MRSAAPALLGVAVLAFLSIPAHADITDWMCQDDDDGAIDCTASWDPNTNELTITGDQLWRPGHMVGSFTALSDPTVTMITFIDNDTTFDWTAYRVKVYMDVSFTLANPSVISSPGGWSGSIAASPSYGPWTDADGRAWDYKGVINYTGGTPVPNTGSNTLGFSYQMSFTGSVQFEQEMIPIPEPATVALLGLGALALLRRKA